MEPAPDAEALRADGWVPAREAGAALGVGPAQVGWLAREGHLASVTYLGTRRWVLENEVEALVVERARWVSYVEAATILGSSTGTVLALVHAGRIEQRGRGTTAVASLGRALVERIAAERATVEAERQRRRRQRAPSAPPDDTHSWLSVPQAAKVLGVTPNGLRWMASEERVPATRCGNRWWLREDLIRLVANARARFPRTQVSSEPEPVQGRQVGQP